MNLTDDTTKSSLPSFVVREKDKRKLLVYLNIPELKVKRSFPNFFKLIPSNGHAIVVSFQNQSFTFTINVQAQLYSISILRLPGEIQPKLCSIKYQRGGCWIELIKLEAMPLMNRICDDLNPGLDTREHEKNY